MNPRKILILEDNKNHIAALEAILSGMPADVSWYHASTAKEAAAIAYEHHIRLFLIDIILDTSKPGDVSGLLFAQQLRENTRYKHTPLIFITSLEDPRYYSYSQLHCYQYIEKPFDRRQVQKIISQALEVPLRQEDDRYLYFQRDGIVYSVYVKEIVCIENSRRKVVIHSTDRSREFAYKTRKEILKELDSPAFVEASRRHIVNRRYIEYIDKANRFVKLKHMEEPIDIGPVMKKAFLESLKDE